MAAINASYLQGVQTPLTMSSAVSESAKEFLESNKQIDETNKLLINLIQSGESGRSPTILPEDNNTSMKAYLQPFRFALAASDYKTWKDQVNAILDVQYSECGSYRGFEKIGHVKYEELVGDFNQGDSVFTALSFTDTSLGGNEAINCRWGFCRDDDIIQPINALGGDPNNGGIGRVYYENYESPAQYLYITAGVPEFNYISKFYTEAIDASIAKDVNNGGWSTWLTSIGNALGTIASTAISLPFMILKYAGKAVSGTINLIDTIAGNREAVTKYYDFRSAMPMYFRYANSLLVHICTNLGLYPSAIYGNDYQYGKGGRTGNHRNVSTTDVMTQQRDGNLDNEKLPAFLREGLSLYKIMSKRDALNGSLSEALAISKKNGIDPSDAVLLQMNNYLKSNRGGTLKDDSGGFWTTFKARFHATMTGADKYICFRLDKNTDASETFSNQTGQSTIQQTLNGMVQQGKNLNFSIMGGKLADVPIIGGILSGIKDVATGILNQFSVAGIANAVMTGSGFFDIPEVWQSSNYSKSYSFTMTFRSPYGDTQSIVQSIYVPLCLLLPLVLPRSVGQNSYTSPFIIRAYAKGMFAIPLGIIDSMQITRGASEFGWNINKLPLVMKVTFSIKDLSPLIHMALHNDGVWDAIFGSNSNMNEYLLTLEGLGVQERTLFMTSMVRRLEVAANLFKQTWGSPSIFAATLFGDLRLSKLFGAIYPDSSMPS